MPWIFNIIGCDTVLLSIRCDGLFALKNGFNDVDEIGCSFEHHKCNNGDKSCFAKSNGLFSFITWTKKHAGKKIAIMTAMDTNIDWLGNSADEKE